MGIEIFKRLTREPFSVTEARAALAPLEAAVDPATFETLRVLVSELVTNSVRHATGAETGAGPEQLIALSVVATRESIRVEVSDEGAGSAAPLPDQAVEDEESGWGLQLVESFSDRWGTEQEGRTRVWFELVDSGAFAHRSRLES